MNQIKLRYGKDLVDLTFADSRYEVLTHHENINLLDDVEIGNAFDEPIQSPPLDELFGTGDSILIVVSDATRVTGSAQIIHLFVRRLIQLGVSPGEIAIIFATGIHRPVTPEEKINLLTPFIAQRVRMIDHDALDAAQMMTLGKTESGTPVELNRALKEYSHVVITGAVGFHYFAGFTGGRKSICPGLASAKTIQATHMLAFDFENGGRRAGVGTGLLDGNAVHAECENIAGMIAPALGINSIVEERGRVLQMFVGDWRVAHREACRRYLADNSLPIKATREVVVASCGGFPYDINLIQAHKALDMAAHACAEGGTIVLLAECAEGLGRPDFLKWFDEENARALEMRLREHYEVNGQTAWSLMLKTERYRVCLISDLPDDVVKKMRMTPARSLDEAISSFGRNVEGFVMPRGAALLPRLI